MTDTPRELALDDYLGGQAVTRVVTDTDRKFPVMLAAALLVADKTERTKLRQAFPKLVASFEARLDGPGGLLPGEHIPGVGFLGEDGRIKLPCGCDRDSVRDGDGTHEDNCQLTGKTGSDDK